MHLLHDNTLTLDNYEKFVYLAGQYNQIIKFYNVEKICAKEIEHIKKLFANYPNFRRFTIGAFFRILIPKILDNLDKSIYIDADTIVNLDIKELWQIEIEDKPLGAISAGSRGYKSNAALCKDGLVNPEDYFGSGVLVMNLEYIRINETENIKKGIEFLSENHKYDCFDQEILNYCFSKKCVHLDSRFDFPVRNNRHQGNFQTKNRINHYTAQGESLYIDMHDPFNRLWFSYFIKTPWFNENTIGNLYNGVRKIYAEQKNLMTQVSAMVSGKRRAFVAFPQNVNALKQIFYVQEGEDIFQINSQNWLNELANAMKESVGKKIYFMLTGGIYPQLRAALMQVGFVEGRDFINGEMFLSELHGVKFNSYPLIASM